MTISVQRLVRTTLFVFLIGSLIFSNNHPATAHAAATAIDDSTVVIGDQVIIMATRLPIYSKPSAQAVISDTLTTGFVSRVLKIMADPDHNTWYYLGTRANGWVLASMDGALTVADYSAGALQGIVVQATAALSNNPASANDYLRRAAAFFSQGHYSAADADFTTALNLGHDDANVLHYRAKNDERMGNNQASIADAQ